MQVDHLFGMDALVEIDFAEGIDLPIWGRAVDVSGDESR